MIDEAYSRLLMVRNELPIEDVFALDRARKCLSISFDANRRLIATKLIEGRKPNVRVAAHIAGVTGRLADYIRTRPQTDAQYATLLKEYLSRAGAASREEVDDLLLPLLPEGLDIEQRRQRISNLLAKLRREGQVRNAGSCGQPRWELGDFAESLQ